MERKIVKAEILWTRTCPVKCSYCAMADGRRNTLPLHSWYKGVDNLKMLGCEFMAFCGAECLTDFDILPYVIRYAEQKGIHTTVITSGTVPDFKDKLKTLHHFGARSLTMSYDMVPLDMSSGKKSDRAITGLRYFQSLGTYRDTAIIATLSRHNFRELPKTIAKMTTMNIWTFFDFIHHDRGQPGSKVNTVDLDLSFREEDFEDLDIVMAEVLRMKEQGFLCHSSRHYLDMIKANDHEVLRKYNWHCAKEENFPAWVTVDCDGRVYCCDDFQIRDKGPSFPITTLYERFDEFSKYWKDRALIECSGCFWNHHIDAHQVKCGNIPITDYVHGIK